MKRYTVFIPPEFEYLMDSEHWSSTSDSEIYTPEVGDYTPLNIAKESETVYLGLICVEEGLTMETISPDQIQLYYMQFCDTGEVRVH